MVIFCPRVAAKCKYICVTLMTNTFLGGLGSRSPYITEGHLGSVPISSQNSAQYLLTVDKAILHSATYLNLPEHLWVYQYE